MLREAVQTDGLRHDPIQSPHRHRLSGLLKLVPAVLAAYELRYLIYSAAHPTGVLRLIGGLHTASAGFWVSALLLASVASLLRVAGQGMLDRLARPRWSRRLPWVWLAASMAVFVLCRWAGLWHAATPTQHTTELARLVGPHVWATIAAAIAVGLVLAASLEGARSFTRAVARWCGSRLQLRVPWLPALGRFADELRLRSCALDDSWSSRGPPLAGIAVSSI